MNFQIDKMYSIVIPTLWKSPRIHKLLFDLIECNSVDEIILIDNNNYIIASGFWFYAFGVRFLFFV